MNDITRKSTTHRNAIATAVLSVSSIDTIRAIEQRTVPKGDVFEFSRAAGLLAIKSTASVVPDCHPIPIEFASISHSIEQKEIHIRVEVGSIYRTGVEVEAMHGAMITALTMYDMLKPIDSQIVVEQIRLEKKSGGKSQFTDQSSRVLRAGVIVCSDSISAGKKTDRAGKVISEKLEDIGVSVDNYVVIPDEVSQIQAQVMRGVELNYDLVIITGGTGLSKRDVTPEAISPLLHRTIPGLVEAARSYGQQRTPYAMLSRSVAGMIGNTLVIALPGSTRGAEESMDAVFPSALHIFRIIDGASH